ncbi:MAG: glucosamine-6-phosphate deaminase [Candidatus Latescibacteria bacterium]|nr:glucosamine-6-phosphate deaminase [Candidatus Latescibacterota bacterium]
MQIQVFESKQQMAQAAACKAAELLTEILNKKGTATFIVATGASQFEFLENLTAVPSIEWAKTVMFHLDEYVGLSESHPASFRRYLKEKLINKVHPGTVHLVRGDSSDPEAECRRLNEIISGYVVDVAFVGIGENGHLAFNDPPADFQTENPYIVVELDEPCRRQQLGEGWFAGLEDVPNQAISMSIRQIMKSKAIVCTVPDKRKAQAVKDCLEEEISPRHPASILREHPNAFLYLDRDAAFLLKEK